MPTTASPPNGVDTDRRRTTVRTLEQHPELGVVHFSAARRWPEEMADGGPSMVTNGVPTSVAVQS